jgi:hypothetical protein
LCDEPDQLDRLAGRRARRLWQLLTRREGEQLEPEVLSKHPGAVTETAQPAIDRVGRNLESTRHVVVALVVGDDGGERRADHLDWVLASQQAGLWQQHVRGPQPPERLEQRDRRGLRRWLLRSTRSRA